MNRPNRRQVLDCASPLALLNRGWSIEKRQKTKRQKTAAVEDADALAVAPNNSWNSSVSGMAGQIFQ
jgi:hypothetical protein